MANASVTTPLSRDLARLMLMMRRLVKEEFTVTVHLDEGEAAEELLAFAARSRSSLLRQMARELEQCLEQNLPAPANGDATPPHHRRAINDAPSAPAPRKTPKRVYRGRVIS